jgi:uncharacterized membrane protein
MDEAKIEEYRQRSRDPNTDSETRDLILEILSITLRLGEIDRRVQETQDIREQLVGIDDKLAKIQQDLAKRRRHIPIFRSHERMVPRYW